MSTRHVYQLLGFLRRPTQRSLQGATWPRSKRPHVSNASGTHVPSSTRGMMESSEVLSPSTSGLLRSSERWKNIPDHRSVAVPSNEGCSWSLAVGRCTASNDGADCRYNQLGKRAISGTYPLDLDDLSFSQQLRSAGPRLRKAYSPQACVLTLLTCGMATVVWRVVVLASASLCSRCNEFVEPWSDDSVPNSECSA